MLRAKRTRQIGVVLPKLSSDSCPRMVEGIGSVLEEWGYRLLLVNTANDAAREVQAMEMLSHNTVDGLILIATVFTPQHKALLENMPLPIVVLGPAISRLLLCLPRRLWRRQSRYCPDAG